MMGIQGRVIVKLCLEAVSFIYDVNWHLMCRMQLRIFVPLSIAGLPHRTAPVKQDPCTSEVNHKHNSVAQYKSRDSS